MTPNRLQTRIRLTMAVVVVAGALVAGSAASLGGIDSDQLWAWSSAADVDPPPPPTSTTTTTTTTPTTTTVPPPVACDDFAGSGELDGRTYSCGSGTWLTTANNWTVSNGRVKPTTAFAKTATVPAGTRNASVAVTVHDNDKGNRQGGVVVSHDDSTTGAYLAAVLVSANRVELRISNAPAFAVAAVTITPSTRLRLTRIDNFVWVEVNGVTVIADEFDLSSLTGTRAGLFHGGGPPVEFSDFVVSAANPPP
jgi:hypothetical protein